MNAVLHDCAKSVRNGTAPRPPPSKFLNERPSTTSFCGHGTVLSTESPSRSSAVVVTTLKVEPGG